MPKIMRPSENNRILAENLTPSQKEMLKKEEQSDKGYVVDINDIKIEWKFLVHHDPKMGLDLSRYDSGSNLKGIKIGEMFKDKEVAQDIGNLITMSDKYYKEVFGKSMGQNNE